MGGLVNTVTDAIGLTDSGAAARAAREGAWITADYQRQALDYLKETDKLPREFREKALTRLGDIYGFGAEGGRQQFFEGLREDPLYETLLGGREEAYLRGQSATGNLRGAESVLGLGNVENQLLMDVYQDQLSGIQSLMGTPNYARDIASGTAGIGRTLGQGRIAQGQAQADAEQRGFENIVGIGKLAISGGLI